MLIPCIGNLRSGRVSEIAYVINYLAHTQHRTWNFAKQPQHLLTLRTGEPTFDRPRKFFDIAMLVDIIILHNLSTLTLKRVDSIVSCWYNNKRSEEGL